MINALLGIKKNMTSTYDARGRRVAATVLEITPNAVTQIKSTEGKDGYDAVQLGFGSKKSVKKPQLGHVKKAGFDKKLRWFREIRVQGTVDSRQLENIKPGTEMNLSQVFSIGDAVKVTGISKGKGFQGGVRRHGFHGGPKTHGQSDRHRAPGAIGSGTTPGRVYKGKKMAGHMGNRQVSVKGLEVVGLDKQKNLLTVKGAVPGFAGSLVTITKLGIIKGYTPPPEEKPSEEEESIQKDSAPVPIKSGPIKSGSEIQNVSSSESQSSDASDKSDTSGTPSASESSEKEEVKENAG